MINKCPNSINKRISDCSGQRALGVDCVSREGEVYVYSCLDGEAGGGALAETPTAE